MSEEKGKTEKEFEGFVSTAMRGPRRGIYEKLLAGKLIQASTVGDPLKKIQNICEAAFLCKKKDKLDLNLVETASLVSASFMNTEITQKLDVMVIVAWAFDKTEENWKRFIKPWNKVGLRYFPLETPYRRRKYPSKLRYTGRSYFDYEAENEQLDKRDTLRELVHGEIRKMPQNQQFFERTAALDRNSFFQLKGEFERWAVTKLLPIETVIAEQIDPRVYGEVAALMMGQKEGEQIEGSVDQRQRRNTV